jgi:hypothetical protein
VKPILVDSNMVPLHIGQEFTEISDIVKHKVTENHSLVNGNQYAHFTSNGGSMSQRNNYYRLFGDS